jgi:hypothetical protein
LGPTCHLDSAIFIHLADAFVKRSRTFAGYAWRGDSGGRTGFSDACVRIDAAGGVAAAQVASMSALALSRHWPISGNWAVPETT